MPSIVRHELIRGCENMNNNPDHTHIQWCKDRDKGLCSNGVSTKNLLCSISREYIVDSDISSIDMTSEIASIDMRAYREIRLSKLSYLPKYNNYLGIDILTVC